MRRSHLTPLCLVLLAPVSLGHGGAYNGPGGGAPGGGGGAPADTVAPPAGGNPGSNTFRVNKTPQPGKCGSGGHVGPKKPGTPTSPSLSLTNQADSTVWQRWWGFHQHGYMDVKGAIHAADIAPDSDSFFLGRVSAEHVRDRLRPTDERIRAVIVPALIAALEDERDADVVTGALIALAKIGDRPDGPSLTMVIASYLADSNQEIAETAAIALGILASPSSEALLRDLVSDRDEGRQCVGCSEGVPDRTRAFAAYGLGLIGFANEDLALRGRILRTLMTTFEGSARAGATPDLGVACLGAISLVPLTAEGRRTGLPWSGRETQLAWLEACLVDGSLRDVTRAHVPIALARLVVGAEEEDRGRTIDRLCSLLEKRDTPRLVQQGLVGALGQIVSAGDAASDRRGQVALLEASRGGGDLDLRHYALVGLGQVAARPGQGEEPTAARPLLQRRLTDALQGGSSVDRPWAALGLGALGNAQWRRGEEPDAVVDGLLRAELEDARSPNMVGALAIACGMRRDPHAVPLLLGQLQQIADDDTRGYLCLSLGMLGAPEALDPVREVVRESRYRPALLRQAAVALGLLGDKHLVPELCGTLEEVQSLAAQASVASGLGAIGDARSVDPLIRMLADRAITPRARAFAAVALGIVSDKESRPWNAKLAIGSHYQANPPTLSDGGGAGVLEIL